VLEVNGERHQLTVHPRRTLADLLRHDLGLVGTQVGCEQGTCGTCTVLVDGEPARSCLIFAVQVDGERVETVESLAAGGELSALQRVFSELHAVQCGFCTPGFLVLATALLRNEPRADRQRIRAELSANLCRCTGYAGIVDAVESLTRS